MLISTVIPTIGRSSLSVSIQSVLDQGLRPNDFEIIVVNDTGKPLSQADWQKSSIPTGGTEVLPEM